jgi:chorismate mutase/prephenate dehydrogenase
MTSRPEAAHLEELRKEIAALDGQLIDILARRLATAAEIGEIKQRLGLPVMDPAREAEVVRRAAEAARDRGIDPELVRAVLWRVIDHARGVQGR